MKEAAEFLELTGRFSFRERKPVRLHQMARRSTSRMTRQNSAAASLIAEDADLVDRIKRHDQAAFESLMRRYNGRLFRTARSIVRDDSEAEDALQDAYLDAYQHIGDFRGGARLTTWLTRIVINRALMRLRKQKRDRVVVPFGDRTSLDNDQPGAEMADELAESPPNATLRAELRVILERRIDALPVAFRTVFVMREVEDMTVEETAESLQIPAATVRSRLFRARALLREGLAREMDMATTDVFGFAGERCNRIVAGVLARTRAMADHARMAESSELAGGDTGDKPDTPPGA
jgi:RNA polymerase sigma-70 factor (ECF subfamily)